MAVENVNFPLHSLWAWSCFPVAPVPDCAHLLTRSGHCIVGAGPMVGFHIQNCCTREIFCPWKRSFFPWDNWVGLALYWGPMVSYQILENPPGWGFARGVEAAIRELLWMVSRCFQWGKPLILLDTRTNSPMSSKGCQLSSWWPENLPF